MKKYLALFLALCALLLTACRDTSLPATTPTATTPETTQATTPETTENICLATPDTGNTVPYTVKIHRADFPMYKGAGYEAGFAGYVKEAGTYTIVAEARDCAGNYWGKLKSGAGWVDVTQITKEAEAGPVISLVPITDELLAKEGLLQYSFSSDMYSRKFLLQANVDLFQVELISLTIEEGITEPTPAHTIAHWNAGTLLLIEASFPGDFNTYGIRVTDSNCVTYRFNVWENLSGEGEPFALSTYAPAG